MRGKNDKNTIILLIRRMYITHYKYTISYYKQISLLITRYAVYTAGMWVMGFCLYTYVKYIKRARTKNIINKQHKRLIIIITIFYFYYWSRDVCSVIDVDWPFSVGSLTQPSSQTLSYNHTHTLHSITSTGLWLIRLRGGFSPKLLDNRCRRRHTTTARVIYIMCIIPLRSFPIV